MEPEFNRLIHNEINNDLQESVLAKEMHANDEKWEPGIEIPSANSRSLQLQFTDKPSLPVVTGNCWIQKHLDWNIDKVLREPGNEIPPANSRSLLLQFTDKLSLPVVTGKEIVGSKKTSIGIALVDALTKNVVNSGPEASSELEVVALKEDFEGDNWTHEEFNRNIVREREGNGHLLARHVSLKLKEGIGFVRNFTFKHTRCWMRKCKYRLGALIKDGSLGIRVREAKTDPFDVVDRRGILNTKHYPPSLLDKVWRLENIGKNGAIHKRLNMENVDTVQDFLRLLLSDPTRLRNILGSGMQDTKWEATVVHARTCILGPKLHLYCRPGSQQKTIVVFNVVGQVRGLLSEHRYIPVDQLSKIEQAEAHKLVIAAFEHSEGIVSSEDEASVLEASSCLFKNVLYSNSSMVESSEGRKVSTSQKIGGFDYPQASACSPDVLPPLYPMGRVNNLDDEDLPNIDNMDPRYDHTSDFPGQVRSSLICETESVTRASNGEEHHIDADGSLQSHNSSSEVQDDLHGATNLFLLASSSAFTQNWQDGSSVVLDVWNETTAKQKNGAYGSSKGRIVEKSDQDLELSLSTGPADSDITAVTQGFPQFPKNVECPAFIGSVKLVDEGSTSSQWKVLHGFPSTESSSASVITLDSSVTCDSGATCKQKQHSTSVKLCQLYGCTRRARGASGLCIAHGGGRRCQRAGCSKGAEGKTVFCKAHGGGRRCQHLGCMKSAVGLTDCCVGHGGGKRCSHESCIRVVRGKSGLCILHGGGKSQVV